MKTAAKVVCALVVLGIGAMLLPLAQEWVWTMKRERVSSQIKDSYIRSASRGEVAFPATNLDALRCSSICFWSLPNCLQVSATSGNTFFYIAHRTTNSASPYTFRFFMETDADGNQITNIPSI
jgi:hypothetical protein